MMDSTAVTVTLWGTTLDTATIALIVAGIALFLSLIANYRLMGLWAEARRYKRPPRYWALTMAGAVDTCMPACHSRPAFFIWVHWAHDQLDRRLYAHP